MRNTLHDKNDNTHFAIIYPIATRQTPVDLLYCDQTLVEWKFCTLVLRRQSMMQSNSCKSVSALLPKHKRKGDDISGSEFASNGVTVVVYPKTSSGSSRISGNIEAGGNGSSFVADDWNGCYDMLQNMIQSSDKENDNGSLMKVIHDISMHPQRFDTEHEKYISVEVESIKQKLRAKLAHEQQSVRNKEEEDIALLDKMNQLMEEKNNAEVELETHNQREKELVCEIESLQSRITREIEEMEQIQDVCKQKVPRLRQQLSLYGNVTGIKWNFAKERVLAGQVVRIILFFVNAGAFCLERRYRDPLYLFLIFVIA